MDAASRPMAQEVFIGIARTRMSASSAFKTRDSARALGALARVLRRGSELLLLPSETRCGAVHETCCSPQRSGHTRLLRCAIGLALGKTQYLSNHLRRASTMAKNIQRHEFLLALLWPIPTTSVRSTGHIGRPISAD